MKWSKIFSLFSINNIKTTYKMNAKMKEAKRLFKESSATKQMSGLIEFSAYITLELHKRKTIVIFEDSDKNSMSVKMKDHIGRSKIALRFLDAHKIKYKLIG